MYFKRIILLLFLFVIFGFFASAQKTTKNYFAGLHKKTVELKDSATSKSVLPFSGVIIRDARQDTSCIAFFTSDITYRVDLENGFVPSITDYIKSSYSFAAGSDSSVNLFMVIKKLWLTDLIGVADNLNPMQTKWGRGVIVEMELFSEKKGLYRALYKTDTAIVEDVPLKGNEEFYLGKAIFTCLEKLSNKQLLDLKNRKKRIHKRRY